MGAHQCGSGGSRHHASGDKEADWLYTLSMLIQNSTNFMKFASFMLFVFHNQPFESFHPGAWSLKGRMSGIQEGSKRTGRGLFFYLRVSQLLHLSAYLLLNRVKDLHNSSWFRFVKEKDKHCKAIPHTSKENCSHCT